MIHKEKHNSLISISSGWEDKKSDWPNKSNNISTDCSKLSTLEMPTKMGYMGKCLCLTSINQDKVEE